MDFLFDDDDNDQGGGGLSFQLSQQSTSLSQSQGLSQGLSQSQQQGLSQSSLLHQQSQSQQSQSHHVQQSQSQFYCHNCGGNSSYVDDITGNLVCKDCFTESQTQIAASQEALDTYEIADLAGRQGNKKSQNFVEAVQKRRRAPDNQKGSSSKIPLEELDQSQSLVNVEDCILGMQRILIETTKIAYKLATQQQKQSQQKKDDDDDSHQSQDDDDDDDDPTELKIVLETIRKLWTSYLKSWYDGAEFFGKLYPEVRFSFRDCFLDNLTRQRLIKTLAYWATIKLRKEIQQEIDDESESSDDEKDEERNIGTRKRKQQQQQKKQKPGDKEQTSNTYADDSLLDDDDDDDDDDYDDDDDHEEEKFKSDDDDDDDDDVNGDGEDSTTGHHKNKSNRKSRMPQIESMIVHHYRTKMQRQRKTTRTNNNNDNNKIRHVGRRAAALLLKPSMTMVASMVWIALAPIGITANHIREWIMNGSLPLRNCFDLLSHDDQEKLHTIRFFFKLSNIPSISVMERNVRALHVACRYKPRKIYVLKRKRNGKSKTNDDIQQEEAEEERQKLISRSTYDFKAGRVITPSSVPMLAARFVSEYGLNQKVLDFTLALMGLKVTTKEDGEDCFLPQPLYKARPDFLLDPTKILGVIVVACKLVPDPCMSKVNQLPEWYLHSYNRPMSTTSVDDDNDDDDSDNNSRRAKKRARRFVPCTDHHFRYINHGGLMADYLEFLEEEVIDTKHPLLVDSIDELKQQKPQSQTTTKSESSTSKSRSHQQQCRNRRARKDNSSNSINASNEEANLTVKPSTTVGYYKQGERAKRRNKEWRKYEISSIPEPGQYSTMPGPIGPFIEYMANKSGTSPVDIMNFVAQLDKSMEKRGKPHFNNMR